MAQVTYRDNNYELCESVVKRDYSKLRESIFNDKDLLTEQVSCGNEIFGFSITINQPLTNLYENTFYVVKFVFSSVDTMHSSEVEGALNILLSKLQNIIKNKKGYYNLRIPTHIVDLLKACNENFRSGFFCGGTVEEYIFGKRVDLNLKESMQIFFCDKKYIDDHKEELLNITYASFKAYQGQYHISPITDGKAGLIYKNWIQEDFESFNPNTILVAEFNNTPCGFVTIAEGDFFVEGKLAAVSDQFRGLGTYRNMIAALINYANEKEKAFLSSTQFDNFNVQSAWSSLGLKPFYSIYNFHIDARK